MLKNIPLDFTELKYWTLDNDESERGVCFNINDHCTHPLIVDCTKCDAFMSPEFCIDLFEAGCEKSARRK